MHKNIKEIIRGIFNLQGKDIKMLPVHSLKAEENSSFILTLIKK